MLSFPGSGQHNPPWTEHVQESPPSWGPQSPRSHGRGHRFLAPAPGLTLLRGAFHSFKSVLHFRPFPALLPGPEVERSHRNMQVRVSSLELPLKFLCPLQQFPWRQLQGEEEAP